ncbi:MAG: pilus assembly protein [Acidobacteriota bacterium]
MKAIADTGFLVAFASATDRYHGWAVRVAEQIEDPLLSCEAVLAETAFHLQDAAATLALVQKGMVRVALDLQTEKDSLARLARKYADRQPDLADLCVIRLSELNPHHSVLTIDLTDFRVYRRNQREIIPLIHPPGL